MRSVWGVVVAATAVTTFSSAAFAAGLYIPDSGTVARSRGGAFVVAADDPLAIYYNPAGLAYQTQTRNQFLMDITALNLGLTFTRDCTTGQPAGATPGTDCWGHGTSAKNTPPPQIVPEILYVHNFSDKLSVGGGLHAPAGARYKFPTEGPQRFTNSELYLVEAGLGVSAAYRVHKMVSVGLTVETLITSVDQTFVVSQHTPSDGAPTEGDPLQEQSGHLKAMQTLNPTGILGVKVTPTDSVEFGLSYRPAVHLNMPGTLDAGPSHENIHFHSDLASILRVGGRYVQPTWDGELDLVYEDWSVHKKDEVTADDGTFVNSGSQAVARKWKAAYSVRAGSTFKLAEQIRGMAGVYYETSAVPKEYMDVGSYDAPKFALSVGAKYDFGARFTLAANLDHTFMTAQTVSTSQQRQQSAFAPPLVNPPTDLTVVGNGKYAGAYDMIGLSLLTKF